jgi:phosphate transport system protein
LIADSIKPNTEREYFMARVTFEREMEQLQDRLLDLGIQVERSIASSIEILKKRDIKSARELIAADNEINRQRFSIESDTLILIARQQPLATDLRTLAAVLEIATELERIADYSKGIAKITVRLRDKPLVKELVDIPRMAQKATDMLHRALVSFIRRDVAMARAIAAEDPEMDAFYQQIYGELMNYVIKDPRNIEGSSHLLWVAHNLERTADRAVNICERVVFTVTGDMIELDVDEEEGSEDF